MTDPRTDSAPLTLSAADEQAIRALVAQAQAAQNDPQELLALHTSGVIIVNLAGRRVLGHEAFADAMAGALTSPLRDVRTTAEILDIRPITPDTAVVSCRKTVHDERPETDTTHLLPTQAP